MANLSITKIDSSLEKRIITGMIVSDKFLQEIEPIIEYSFFLNSYARKVAEWCTDFFDEYKKAPFEHIQDVFNLKKAYLKEEESEIISKLLTEVSERYSYTNTLNSDYLIQQTVSYFKKRDLAIRSGNIQIHLDRNDVDGAEKELEGYRKIDRLTSPEVNPFSDESISAVFASRNDSLLTMPGQLGKFMGPFERNWLLGLTGPFKRGKTWFLQEIGIQAMLSRLRVVFVSLEMKASQMVQRIYQRVTSLPKNEGGKFLIPVFDCMKNQDGTCVKSLRTSRVPLRDRSGKKPEFSPQSQYNPCTSCRTLEGFVTDYWFKEIERPTFSREVIEKQVHSFNRKYFDSFRLLSYPRFSANISDIQRDLDKMVKKGFIPDVIIIDYADILRPESEGPNHGIEQVDVTWKTLAKLAGERSVLVATGTQANKEALDAEQVKQKHTSLWIGKLAHVDAMATLNQTEIEKKNGIMRIGMMAHRHEDFSESANCYILQNLFLGQPLLDSQIRRSTE